MRRAFCVTATLLITWTATTSCTREPSVMEDACARRGVIAKLGRTDEARCEGSRFAPPTQRLRSALGGESPDAVTQALYGMQGRALWVDIEPRRRGPSIGARLARAEAVDGFRTMALANGVMLVEPYDWPAVTERESWALAEVSRKVLAGTPAPTLNQFPTSLRSPTNVEVMVLLRQNGSPIFWRSARGASIASALLLALGVARSRWSDRSSVLDGPLEERIGALTVEIWLIAEDGTYSDRDHSLFDMTLGTGHGVGYETNGSWHYELRERLGNLRGVAAFNYLFSQNHLDERALERADLRLYRLRATRLARSVPEPRRMPSPRPEIIQDADSL